MRCCGKIMRPDGSGKTVCELCGRLDPRKALTMGNDLSKIADAQYEKHFATPSITDDGIGDDLVARLRDPVNNWNSGGRFEAADRIEALLRTLAGTVQQRDDLAAHAARIESTLADRDKRIGDLAGALERIDRIETKPSGQKSLAASIARAALSNNLDGVVSGVRGEVFAPRSTDDEASAILDELSRLQTWCVMQMRHDKGATAAADLVQRTRILIIERCKRSITLEKE